VQSLRKRQELIKLLTSTAPLLIIAPFPIESAKEADKTMKSYSRIYCCAVFALFLAANSHALYYWDLNGNAPGSGGPAPSGTWNVSGANWSTDDSGTNAAAYNNSGTSGVVFSAGTDATGSYTVTVDNSGGQISVGDMHCDDGNPTLAGGPLTLGGNAQLFSAILGHVFTINCVLQNSATNNEAFHKYKLGTLVLGGSNTLHGDITIEGGTIMLAGNQHITAASALVLTNGDDRGSDGFVDTPAIFNTGGFNQTLGSLVLNGPNSAVFRTLDFSNGHGTLSFANSSANSWSTTANNLNNANPGSITLVVTNFSVATAKLRFGSNSNGLTATQLGQIHFADYLGLPGVIDNSGFVTPALPVMQSVQIVGPNVQITWTDVPNWTYELQFRNDFSSGWQSLGTFSSNGNTITTQDGLTPTEKFYRVQVLSGP
jgi:autotransporter-associated beta strand protein